MSAFAGFLGETIMKVDSLNINIEVKSNMLENR